MLYHNERASMTRSKVLAAFIIIILFAVVLLKRPCPSFGTRICFPIITVFIILAHTHTLSRNNIPYFAFREIFFHISFIHYSPSLLFSRNAVQTSTFCLDGFCQHITFFFQISDIHGTPLCLHRQYT